MIKMGGENSVNNQAAAPVNHRSIFWISVLALFTAALANSIRAGAAGAIKTAMLDPIDPQRGGEMIGTVLGNSFLGFALSLVVISPLLDRIGAKKAMLFAAACFIAGPTLVLASAGVGASVYTVLNIAMIIWGCGWGATEATINPLTTTIYPDDKTGRLNVLHAWWPAGIVLGGLLSVLFFKQLELGWEWLIGLTIVPGVALAIWTMQHEFPHTESTAKGVTFADMMSEPFKRPSFWVFFVIMFLTASAELAPGTWRLGRCDTDRDRRLFRHFGAGLCFRHHVRHAAFRRRAGTSFFRHGTFVVYNRTSRHWPLSVKRREFGCNRADRSHILGIGRLLHVANHACRCCASLSQKRAMGHWLGRLCGRSRHPLCPATTGRGL